jgi:hypothetical protein
MVFIVGAKRFLPLPPSQYSACVSPGKGDRWYIQTFPCFYDFEEKNLLLLLKEAISLS